MNSVTLSIFQHLFASVAEEMGGTLGRTAYSPNIKERLDFSCAIFLRNGEMLAQAAHIPVHLGAMPSSVKTAIRVCSPFRPGDVVILNDPYLGGTHLPDITLVSPVFADPQSTKRNDFTPPSQPNRKDTTGGTRPRREPAFFVASRAHHADIGGMSPGSMPLSSEIYQEGLIVPPVKLLAEDQRNDPIWQLILNNVRTPVERDGDLAAQLAAHDIGQKRLQSLIEKYGLQECLQQAGSLIEYANRMTRAAIRMIPDGRYTFRDYLDDDGHTAKSIAIQVAVTIQDDTMTADFQGTDPAVQGNLNAVPAIVESAVAYCLRCLALALLETELPMNQGAFEPLTIVIEPGSLLDPQRPHAVAAGNVETSQRLVDVVFGALAQALPGLIPAASQGTMNNLTVGSFNQSLRIPGRAQSGRKGEGRMSDASFAYYETIGGGIGAGSAGVGGDGMHSHMTNTLNTPIEALEYAYPLRVVGYSLREGSGGPGRHRGGDGLVRTLEFLSPVTATAVCERRSRPPYGLAGGEPGKCGRNTLIREEEMIPLPGKFTRSLEPGDRLQIETPGGGGWGRPESGEP